jgi:large-conductance mechanosensitive channel
MKLPARRPVIEAARRVIPLTVGVVIGTMIAALMWSLVP